MSAVMLADGRPAVVRAMRPRDRPDVAALFAHASEQNLYTRFFSLGSDVVTRHLDHLFDPASGPHCYVVVVAGRVVGVADVEPVDLDTSEIAFFVADELHGLGVGTLLLERAAHDAHHRGVPWFVSDVLALNHLMLQVFTDAGYALESHREGSEVSVRMSTAATGGSRAASAARHTAAVECSERTMPPVRPVL